MKSAKILIGALVVLVVLGALGFVVVSRVLQAMQDPPQADRGGATVAVEVAPVQTGPIRDLRTLTGTLVARAQYEVAPRISGRIDRLLVDIGDTVQRGQVVAELDDEEYQQQVQQSQAELLVAQANLDEKRSTLEIVQREFQRVQRLHEQQIASDSELDAARSRLQAEQAGVKVAEAQVAQRQAALRAAQVRLSYARIVANWQDSGETRVVGERFVNEGATVAANSPLISLLDLDTLTAVVYVTEGEYQRLRIGQEATLSGPGGRQTITGRVVRIAPLFREGTRQARVELELDNRARILNPGMFVRVSLELDRNDHATVVPRQSLVRRDGRQGVFLVDETGERARFVPVTIGIAEGERVQVIDPPISGEVVTLGQHLLGEGMAITIVERTREPQAVAGGAGEASQ